MKTRQERLEDHSHRIYSKKGGWKIGQAVFNHGFSMLDELVGKISYFQLLILNVTGRLPSEKLSQWLEASYICMSWPDSRIWCNQIGALAGTSRTKPSSACVAGALASDSLMYGPGSLPACMRTITKAVQLDLSGHSMKQISSEISKVEILDENPKPQIPGFARPVAKGDERVNAMKGVGKELGFEPGRNESFAVRLSEYLDHTYGESINIGGYTAAFLLDQGFSVEEVYRITVNRVSAGVQACYSEAADALEGGFLPLKCQDIIYIGHKSREF